GMQSKELEKLEQDVIDEHDSVLEDKEHQHEAAVALVTDILESAHQTLADAQPAAKTPEGDDPTKLVQAEDRVKGKVTGDIYKNYFNETGLNGVLVLVVVMVVYSASQAVRTLVDWWQGHWAKNMVRDGVDPTYSNLNFGMWYLGFIVICCVVTVARGLMLVEACIRSSRNLHTELLQRVLRAPVNLYFDVTPVGRILNRFSNDLDQVDASLPQQYQLTFQNLALCVGAFAVSAASSYWIALSYIPMIAAFIMVGRYFHTTSREVKRLEGITRTPVFNLFSETLTGLHTIRAFKMENKFIEINKQTVDTNATVYFTYWCTGRWLAARLDLISVVVIFFISLYLVATKGQISAVVAGISLSYSLMLTSIVQSTVRYADRLDNTMTSVERLLHFRSIPAEDDGASCTPINRE
ncbi:Abc transporter c family member 2, partial [Globisporangium polare]